MVSSALSFRGLVSLQTLDLSRNRLRSAPAEAFSYLSWLTSLDLDLNSWNCSCQLLELAAFLSAFIQQPDKVSHRKHKKHVGCAWEQLKAGVPESNHPEWSLLWCFKVTMTFLRPVDLTDPPAAFRPSITAVGWCV